VKGVFGAGDVIQSTTTNHEVNILKAERGGLWVISVGVLAGTE
jgi:hypothetical protein